MSFKLGLTGGIACGKTVASKAFSALGIPVIDADKISRSLTEPGKSLLNEIFARFGPEVANPDGTLNRAALREKVFKDDSCLADLNTMMHDKIRAELIEQSKKAEDSAPYVVLAIPLLFENHLEKLVDRILVLDADENTQLERIIARDGCSKEVALAIVRKQIPRSCRRSLGDDLIDTSSLEDSELGRAITLLHDKYMALSNARGGG